MRRALRWPVSPSALVLSAAFVTVSVTSCLSLSGLTGGVDDTTDGGEGGARDGSATDHPSPTSDVTESAAPIDAPPDVTCTDGGTACKGVCVDLTTSALNCGECGAVCTGGMCTSGYCLTELDNANTGQTIYALSFTGSLILFAAGSMSQSTFAGGPVKDYAESVFEILPSPPSAMATDTVSVFIGGSGYFKAYATGPGTIAPLEAGTVGTVAGIAVDATNVYWTDSAAQAVLEMPKGGGTIVTLAMSQAAPTGIAIDTSNVYWIANNQVMKTPIASAGAMSVPPPTMLAATTTNPSGPTPIAVQTSVVYWSDYQNGQILSIPTGGGMPSPFATEQQNPAAIASDGKSIYWTTDTGMGTLNKELISGGTPITMVIGLPQPTAMTLGYNEVFVATVIDSDGYLLEIAPK